MSLIKTMVERKKTRYFVLISVAMLLVLVMTTSYALFVTVTDKFKVSEMYIGNLLYNLEITNHSDSNAVINNVDVLVEANKTETVYLKIKSLNPVKSKYQIEYKAEENVTVCYSSNTSWLPYGEIDKSEEMLSEKIVKVIINNKSSESKVVHFFVKGGYYFNDIKDIEFEEGFTKLLLSSDETETIVNPVLLTSKVEKDLDCKTNELNSCLFIGNPVNNYIQYPTNSDKTKNLWRILGNYYIDGEVVTKLISVESYESTFEDSNTVLENIISLKDENNLYFLRTDLFNCTYGNFMACGISTKFKNNVGLINKSEYEIMSGVKGYLNNSKENLTMTHNSKDIYYITEDGKIEYKSVSSFSNVNAVVYLQSDIQIIGAGTLYSPYMIVKKSEPEGESLSSVILKDNEEKNISIIDLNKISSDENGKGLYYTNDNTNSTCESNDITYVSEGVCSTYFYRGNVNNNYVAFGNDDVGNDLLWRIVRINEDGSVKLTLGGNNSSDAFISLSQYNTSGYDAAYVGYMLGLNFTGNSESYKEAHTNTYSSKIKEVVDLWYEDYIFDKSDGKHYYDEYVSKTAIYCNNRNINEGNGFGKEQTLFSLYNNTPSFKCENNNASLGVSKDNDSFTSSSIVGNGRLSYPVALLTYDEVIYAGGNKRSSNNSYYLYQNASAGSDYWWTMSPYQALYGGSVYRVGAKENSGMLSSTYVSSSYGVRPALSLKSCVSVISGNGTNDNPYKLGITNNCANKEN